MTKAYDDYQAGIKRLLDYRKKHPTEDGEDKILDELDSLWDAMTKEDLDKTSQRGVLWSHDMLSRENIALKAEIKRLRAGIVKVAKRMKEVTSEAVALHESLKAAVKGKKYV